jgi:hypothetical protein
MNTRKVRLAALLPNIAFTLILNVPCGQARIKCLEQKPSETQTAVSQLTVDMVIQLHTAGISDDVLITKIKQANKPLDLSPAELLRLKEAKVSDLVIQVMMDPAKPATPPPPAVSQVVVPGMNLAQPTGATPSSTNAATGDPDNPDTPHDSGIYLLNEGPIKHQMILLEPAAYTGTKTGGVFAAAMTGGLVKAKQKAVIQGAKAAIRVSNPQPVFYFYFEDKAAALGKVGWGGGGVSSPNQFTCIHLNVKKNTRETIIMEVGAFGASSGTQEKSIMTFKSEKLRPGVYKVIFLSNLEPGEYAFLVGSGMAGAGMAGAAMPLQIFDFGITSGK